MSVYLCELVLPVLLWRMGDTRDLYCRSKHSGVATSSLLETSTPLPTVVTVLKVFLSVGGEDVSF